MSDTAMKVGELASRTGLTVRTLHHYDEIGLLRPGRRTASGHRLYGLDEVRRLQQIASLRQLGLSLDEIRAALAGPGYSLERVLALQVERLQADIARQTRLVGMLESLRRRMADGGELSVEEVTASIEATVHFERYYTPEQREALARQAQALGPEGLEEAQEAWRRVFADLADAQAQGWPPEDPRVLAVARRARALVEAFTGGDPGIRASLERMYREGAGQRVMEARGVGPTPEIMAFFGRAMAALRAAEPGA